MIVTQLVERLGLGPLLHDLGMGKDNGVEMEHVILHMRSVKAGSKQRVRTGEEKSSSASKNVAVITHLRRFEWPSLIPTRLDASWTGPCP